MILALTAAGVLTLITIWLWMVRNEKRRAESLDRSHTRLSSQLKPTRRVR